MLGRVIYELARTDLVERAAGRAGLGHETGASD